MKKYIIKYADGRECSELKSSYKSRNEASNALMEYIYNNNEYLNISVVLDFALKHLSVLNNLVNNLPNFTTRSFYKY